MSKDDPTCAQDIVDTIREPLLVLDPGLRVRSANRAFYHAFRVSPAETEGRLIYRLGDGQWDIPALRTLLEDIVPADSAFDGFEFAYDFPVIGPRVLPRRGPPAVLKNPGFPVGLTEEAYTERTIRLAVGDRLFLYSDGLPEAMNAAGDPYREARLVAAIDRDRSVPLAAAVADLLADVERWSS
jgi:PAS domain-containing protein